jgi:hypothetical protein
LRGIIESKLVTIIANRLSIGLLGYLPIMLELDIWDRVGYRGALRQQVDCAELQKSEGRDSTNWEERGERAKEYGQ